MKTFFKTLKCSNYKTELKVKIVTVFKYQFENENIKILNMKNSFHPFRNNFNLLFHQL